VKEKTRSPRYIFDLKYNLLVVDRNLSVRFTGPFIFLFLVLSQICLLSIYYNFFMINEPQLHIVVYCSVPFATFLIAFFCLYCLRKTMGDTVKERLKKTHIEIDDDSFDIVSKSETLPKRTRIIKRNIEAVEKINKIDILRSWSLIYPKHSWRLHPLLLSDVGDDSLVIVLKKPIRVNAKKIYRSDRVIIRTEDDAGFLRQLGF